MTERNKKIINLFSQNNSWEENYRKIIELGKKLNKFDEKDREERWLIKACQSPLWLKVEKNSANRLIFTGDSTGLIAKGILALVIAFYNERSPEEILKDKPLFIEELELSQYLSSRRTNGLQALLDQVLQYAKAFLMMSKNRR